MKYATTNGWTKRRMVNHIKKHFKGQSIGPDTNFLTDNDGLNCFYRGPNGKKCAVGLFIPDDIYEPSMERQSVITLCNHDERVTPELPLEPYLMEKLQQEHDYNMKKSSKEATLKRMLNWINENVR